MSLITSISQIIKHGPNGLEQLASVRLLTGCSAALYWSRSFLHRRPSPRGLSGAAVQEERQRNREREGELEFSVSVNEEMPVEKILAAETAVEQKTELHSEGVSSGNSVRRGGKTYWQICRPGFCERGWCLVCFQPHDAVSNICQTADKQLFALVEWAKRIPHFSELPLEDQVILLRAGTIQQGNPSRAASAASAAALTFHLGDGLQAAAVKSKMEVFQFVLQPYAKRDILSSK